MEGPLKFHLHPRHSESNNTIATLLKVLAIIIYVCGFLAGIVTSVWSLMFLYWFAAFFSGSLLLGFSEVIRLLDLIAMKGYSVTSDKTSRPVGSAVKRTAMQTTDAPDKHTDKPSNRTVNTAQTVEIPDTSAASYTFQCPVCGALQRYDREICWKCGTHFKR